MKRILLFIIFTYCAGILYSQNTILPVGSIEGDLQVSPSGSVTYTIPIEVVPGPNGFQPSLSVSYNSLAETGILGTKCSLNGLSVIGRIGQTTYHDGKHSNVCLDTSDRFSMDGMRLMRIGNGSYIANNAQYVPEIENYTRVTAVNVTNGQPDYFSATTENGTIIQYGNGNNSQQAVNGKIVNWLISSATNINENRIIYNYGQANGEIWLNSISYGPYNIKPYGQVFFEYDDYTHLQSTFVGGYEIKYHKLLRQIIVKYSNTVVRRYVFNYEQDYDFNTNSDSIPLLKEVVLYGSDGTQLNSTNIDWYPPTTMESSISNPPPTYNLFSLSPRKHIVSDFNNDGACDIVQWHNSPEYVFLSNGNTVTIPSIPHYPITECISMDIDGSGYNKLLTVHELDTDNHVIICCTDFHSQSNPVTDIFLNFYPNQSFNQIFAADITGDGKEEAIVWYDNTKLKIKGEICDFTTTIAFGTPKFGDFNGNGKVDILVINNSSTGEYRIYEYNTVSESLVESLHETNYNVVGAITVGDFNGDGVSDLLCNNSGYRVSFGSNNKFPTSIGIDYYNDTGNPNQNPTLPVVVDLNGDGKDDLIGFNRIFGLRCTYYINCGYVNNKLILYHYPNIQTNLLTQQELNYGGYFSVGDIDNDKLPELLVYKPIDGYQCNLQVHKFNGMRKTPLVSSITDGIGKQHTIDYRLFSGKTMRYGSYRRQPVVMYLPDTLHCSDGLGSNSLLSFEYKNVCFSHNRRCFLGFEEFNTHNPSTQTTVSELFTPNSNICLLLPQKSETFVQSNYNPIRETITSYTHFQLSAGMVLQPSQVIEKDNLNQTSRVTNNTYHPQTGKLYEMEELTRITGSQDFVTKNTTTYTYSLVTLPNGVQKYRKNSESIVSEMTGSTAGITANRLIRYLYKNGRLSKIINSDNGGFSDTVNYTYNNKGQLVSQQHKAANCATETTHYTYDGTKRFVTSKSNDYFTEFTRTYDNATGNVLTETDANGLTTSYQYDAFGRLVLEQSPYGTYTQYSYEWFSSDIPHSIYRQKMISPGTPTAYVYYDILGREICKQTGNIRTDVRYNSLGQREKESHPYYFSWTDDLKKWHNFQYDLYGRLSAEIAPYKDLSYSYSERQQTVHDNIRNTDNVKLHDAAGRLVQSTDPGGTINYSYKYVSDNNLIRTENTFSAVGATTTVVSDLQDNRLSFTEPNAGVVNSVYDNFGRLVSQTDARGVTTVFTYDLLNRCVRKQFASGGDTLTHTFIYDSLDATNVWKGAMMAVRVNDSNAVFYHYDNVGRLVEKITRIEGEDFSFGYTYDSLNRSNTVIYPNNFAIKYDYDEESRVYAIRNNTTQAKLYKVRDRDLLQRAKIIVYDNETGSQYYRNDYGNIIRIRQGNTLFPEDMLGRDSLILEEQPFIDKEYRELYYTYNDAGLMSSRKDSVTHFQETFEYDNLDRLTAFTVTKTDGSITELHTTSFADNGNILANSHVGTYHYDCDKPHAVTGITLDSTFVNAISAARCDVHYNLFNQPDTIKEGQWKLVLYYGPDQTRWKTVLFKDSNVFETHWYIGDDYEKVTNSSNETAHFNIVRGEENAVVIGYQGYGSDFYYYVHPDILGNWCVINGPGERPRLIHFDPWGNPRKFNNWTLVDSTTLANSILPARGFTGHEHLQRFNIINMKGRLYDPVIGRFFSPDNFVQLPDFTQNYNRYSYCLNNPLKYVDPSGEGFADALLWISNFLSIPARIFTEGVECFNDLINGEIQESGYFHWDYLTGTASPYPVDTRNIIYNQVDHNEFYDISKSHSSVIDADNISFAYEMYWAGFEMYGYEFQKGSGKTWYQRSKYKKWGHINIRRTKIDDLDDILSKSNMYIGCFGTGLKKVKGSVRFTNGIFNGNHLSYKYYATGWNGGSRAGIKTYNVGKLGKTISRTTMGLSVLYGVNEVADGYMLDGGRWGYNSNMALFKTIGSTGGSIMGAEIGAEIGLLFGGFGAIPGALIGGIIFDYFGEKAGEQLIINMY